MDTLFFYFFKKLTKSNEDIYWRYYFDFSKKRKFDILNSSMEDSSPILKVFCNIQQVYNGFARLANLFRYKRTPVQNTTDLGLNPIAPKRKTHTFLHEGAKYIMTIPEIIQTVNAALSHVNGFFILNNYMPKNPYTNVPFSKSNLYNMYFAVKCSDFKMSSLFYSFFLYDFQLELFTTVNQNALTEYAISQYVYNSHHSLLHQDVKNMINNHGMMRQLYIDPLFPKDVLVNSMRPYLLLNLRLEYANIPEEEWADISMKLTNSLNLFYMYNPKFGRKYIYYKNRKRIIDFEVAHTSVLKKKKYPILTVSF